jgi:hypothetical protein
LTLELYVNTFFRDLKLARFGYLDRLDRPVARLCLDLLNLLDDIEALEDLAEDDVAAIKPRGDDGGDEELRAVGVLASVGHGEETLLGVLELEVLIRELLAVD